MKSNNNRRAPDQVTVTFSLPRDLLAIIDATAAADGRTRSNLIVQTLRREFGARMAAQAELDQEAAGAPVFATRPQPEAATPTPRAKAK